MDVKTRTQARVVAEIRAKIAMAMRKVVRASYATGPLYAELIRAVITAEKAHISRIVIARTIRAELEAEKHRRLVKHTTGKIEEIHKISKGGAARYVMLARWEQGKFLKDRRIKKTGRVIPAEKHVESVEIDGHKYKSPVEALESKMCSFRKVFLAWREAVRPPMTDLTVVPTSPQDSAQRIIKRLTLPLLVKENGAEIVRRVKVLESAEALAALLDILHASPLAKEAERLRETEGREVVRRPRTDIRHRRAA